MICYCTLLTIILTILPTEIETTTGSYFMSVDSKEERDEWIDSITKASVSYERVQIVLLKAGGF